MILSFLPHFVIASTDITENITQNTTWNTSDSPYIITKEIQVFDDVTLTINPGVEVRFDQDAALIVAGELKAVGMLNNKIKFTSNSSTPSMADWKYIQFLDTATTTAYQPEFEYDYANHQILLTYSSGTIFDYCIIEYADIGIVTTDIYPGVKNSNIKNCNVGVSVNTSQSDPPVSSEKWFFFYGNTVENCEEGLAMNTVSNTHAIISNNIFKNNEFYGLSSNSGTKSNQAWESGMMVFNNQFINNIGTAIQIFGGDTYIAEPFVFLANNNITFNGKGVSAKAYIVAIQNYIANNRSFSYLSTSAPYISPNGGGINLYGPQGYLFNNTIQQNGVDTGGHGDGIYLETALWEYSYKLNEFVIRNNNLGNSVWDTIDIYVGSLPAQCSNSKELEVDATENSWMTPSIADVIFDGSDDACAGVVHFEPKASAVMIPSSLDSHPTLLSPANYSEVKQNPPNNSGDGLKFSYSVDFSWSPVPSATKYLLCTYGKEYLARTANNIVEVINGTSRSITLYIRGTAEDHYVHWFVVAGNDDGWGLPSEIRHVRIVDYSRTNDDNAQDDTSGGDGGGSNGCYISTMGK